MCFKKINEITVAKTQLINSELIEVDIKVTAHATKADKEEYLKIRAVTAHETKKIIPNPEL